MKPIARRNVLVATLMGALAMSGPATQAVASGINLQWFKEK